MMPAAIRGKAVAAVEFDPKNERYFTVAVYVLICALVVSVFAVSLFNFGSVLAALGTLWKILKPVAYGVIFAVIISSPARFFEERAFAFLDRAPRAPSPRWPRPISRFIRRVRSAVHRNAAFKRGCALAVTYMLILTFVAGFMVLVAPQVVRSYRELTEVLPRYLASAQRWLDAVLDQLPIADIGFADADTGEAEGEAGLSAGVPDSEPDQGEPGGFAGLGEFFELDGFGVAFDENDEFGEPGEDSGFGELFGSEEFGELDELAELADAPRRLDLADILKRGLAFSLELMRGAMPQILGALGSVVTELKNIALGLIISVYLLYSREKLIAQMRKYLCSVLPVTAVEALAKVGRITAKTFTEFVTGKIIDAIVIGVLCTVSMMIFRLPYPALIGMLVGVTNVIPFLGPFLGAVPGAIIIFLVSPIKAVWFVLLIIVLQQLDCNFIEPYIISDKTGLESVYIVTSVVVMGGMFGVVGLFLGVPTFAVIYALVKDWSESRLAKKSLPTESSAYAGGAFPEGE